MARPYTTEDAKDLIYDIRESQEYIKGILHEKQTTYKSAVEKAAITVLTSEVLADNIADNIRRGQSKTPRTFDIQALVDALYQYMHWTLIAESCQSLINSYESQINESLHALQISVAPLRRFFAGSKAKASADAAYNVLVSLADGEYGLSVNQIKKNTKAIKKVPYETSFAEFESSPSSYFSALKECAPKTVNADRAFSQLFPIIARHNTLLQQFNNDCPKADNMIALAQQRVREYADKAIMVEAMRQLRGLEIETLAQRRSGIRIKTLRDAGYRTIADVYSASEYNLVSIQGISSDAAKVIKNAAREMAQEVQKTIKLKISADERTDEATGLLTATYAYMQERRAVDIKEAIGKVANVVTQDIGEFQKLHNVYSWLFLSDSGRKHYIDIHQHLSNLIGSEYTRNIESFHAMITENRHYSPAEVWGYFSDHSIEFFNVLEQIVPGILGNGDSLYGLPEELAREIQDQTYFPQGLKITLRRYQEWGVKYILHQERVLLGDEMGLGKTVQALGTMVSLRNTGATHFLVVCPASVLPNWCKEIDRKSEFRSTKVHGYDRQDALDDWIKTGGVAVTTYETTSLITFPSGFQYDLLIVDEAHYIKNAEAKRSKSVRELSRYAKRLLFMTGTALENRVEEMVSLIDILRPSLTDRIRSLAFMSSAPQFREQIAPVYYRRKRDDVLTELPEVIENEEMCELFPEEEALYEDAVLTKNRTAIRRVSWTLPDLNKSSKARRMREIISDAEEDGRKVLVFSFYRDTLRAAADYLGSRCTQIINGSVPVERRQEIIDEFEDMPAGSVLLAQINAGGTGLNIQAASVVIICEPQLKPSIENQAIARAHRMGQSRTVLVYRLLAADTIDERIEEMLKEKQAIFDAFADISVAADATKQEESQIDDKTFGKLIEDEIARINSKNGNVKSNPSGTDQEHAPSTAMKNVKANAFSTEPSKITPPSIGKAIVQEFAPKNMDEPRKSGATVKNAKQSNKVVTQATEFQDVDAFVAYLVSQGIDYKDNRSKNGCLWINADALPDGKMYRVNGTRLNYAKAAKALQGAAGWYIS